MFKDLKESMKIKSHQIENKYIEIFKKNQIEILEFKIIKLKQKIHWRGLTAVLSWQKNWWTWRQVKREYSVWWTEIEMNLKRKWTEFQRPMGHHQV